MARWRQRFAGIALGFLVIQAMNIPRIISLFCLRMCSRTVFSLTHLYLWPVLDVLVVFLCYLRAVHRRAAPA
jgi:exosortase/archaeosortase family protein